MTGSQSDGVKAREAAFSAPDPVAVIAPPTTKKVAPAPVEASDDIDEPVKVEKETAPKVEKAQLLDLIDEWDQ